MMKVRQWNTEQNRYPSQVRLHSLLMPLCFALLFGVVWGLFITTSRVSATGSTITIHITGTAQPPGFRPSLVTVHIADSIVFLNDAQPTATYTIAASDQSFVSPPIPTGHEWSVMFSKPGTHEYHALSISQSMVGLIIVAPASVKLLPTPAPGVVATEIAQIQSERRQPSGPPSSGSGLSTATVIIMVALALVLIGVAVSSLLFLRRRRHA